MDGSGRGGTAGRLFIAAMLLIGGRARSQAVHVPGDAEMADRAMTTVSKYKAVLTAPPKVFFTSKTPDALLAGNGDVGAVFGGTPDELSFFFGKNEFWTTNLWTKSFSEGTIRGGGLMPMCRLDLSVPDLAGASYRAEGDLATAEITGTFRKGSGGLVLHAWLSGAENLHVVELEALGSSSLKVTASLVAGSDLLSHASGSFADGIWLLTGADARVEDPGPDVKTSTRVIGAAASVSGGALAFTVAPGAKVLLVTSLLSNFDDPDYAAASPRRVEAATGASIDGDKQAHRAWWKNYWGKASIQIADTLLEKYWYGSFYLLGCISRGGELAPGLWGPWATSHPMGWRGDFTLNHDYQAPFLPLYSGNRIEQADSYEKPLIDWIPEGRKEAQRVYGAAGVLYKAHIGPLPGGTVDTNRWSELYAGNFAATNTIFRWYSTYDLDYARKIYPFLSELDAFWQSYMKLENNRYMIYKDNLGEARTTSDVNNSLTRSTNKALYSALLEISEALGVDADRRDKWRFILAHLSPYTIESNKTLRCTETGRTGCVRTYPILYDQVFGMEAPKDTFDIAVNTVQAMGNWSGANWLCFTYMAAARAGYDPNSILDHLRNLIRTQSHPNLHLISAGGGTENLANNTAPMNEMLLQSCQNVIRVFSNWPRNIDASFYTMRAYGAFLVSSELSGGDVRYVTIRSEKGRPATVRNPWPGKPVALRRGGGGSETIGGDKLTFATQPGETIVLAPQGRDIDVAARPVPPRGKTEFIPRHGALGIRAPYEGRFDLAVVSPAGKTLVHRTLSGRDFMVSAEGLGQGIRVVRLTEVTPGGTGSEWKTLWMPKP